MTRILLVFESKQVTQPEELSIADAVGEFITQLNFYGKDTTDLQQKVAAFVSARSENGILKTNAKSRRGKILVKL